MGGQKLEVVILKKICNYLLQRLLQILLICKVLFGCAVTLRAQKA
jgi:hypothetical protein